MYCHYELRYVCDTYLIKCVVPQGNCTVAHYSAQLGHEEITEMLIDEYGVDPASKSDVCMYVCM